MRQAYLRADISAAAIRENLRRLRSCLAPGVRVCVPVKCNAYGHGLSEVLDVISREVDCLAVATPAEALEIRELGYDGPLLLFFAAGAEAAGVDVPALLEELLRRRVAITTTSLDEVKVLSSVAERTGLKADVHVKVDTGMTRSGAPADQAGALVERIRSGRGLCLAGVYTHLACADEADKSSAREQLTRFDEVLTSCRLGPDSGVVRHAANSAGLIDLPESHYDMVRPGIATYGYPPGDGMERILPLRPSLRLTAPVVQMRSVPAGIRCGYGLTHTFLRPSVVGLAPIGYGDGYFRCLSNRATMRVAGRDVPVCGRVSMDQTIIDLTDVPEARVGMEVEIYSPQTGAPHSVENLARLADTNPYEIVTRLGPRAIRTLVD